MTKNFGGTNAAVRVNFPKAQIGVTSVQFIVKSGSGDGQGFAACAEMEFYKKNPDAFDPLTLVFAFDFTRISTSLKLPFGPEVRG